MSNFLGHDGLCHQSLLFLLLLPLILLFLFLKTPLLLNSSGLGVASRLDLLLHLSYELLVLSSLLVFEAKGLVLTVTSSDSI